MNNTKLNIKIFSLLFFTCCFAYANSIPANATSKYIDSAEKFYEQDLYAKAAMQYEKILAEGKESWLLYFNLGNAYYKDGKTGLAILNYEKAKKLNPNQPDVINNLSIAENKVIDKVKMKEISLEKEIKSFFVYRFSTTGWAWCTIIFLGISLGLLFIYFTVSKPGIRRLCFWSGSLMFFLFSISFLLGYIELNDKNSSQRGVIISSEVKVYNKPKVEESSRKSLVLHEGTKVKILDRDNDLINIQLLNGNEGWILTKDLGIY